MSSDDKGLTDKLQEAGQKAADKIEPSEQELHGQADGPDGASSPFGAGSRADEQPATDGAGGSTG